ncbi:MAG TPA: hypothetical protein VNZ44_06980, partial [Pyrinomonadaceae bacterium]|nr:hypothetical protein [Pyrinomonadaceae bacterium]
LSTPDCPEPGVKFSHFAKRMEPNMVGGLAEWYIKSIPSKGEKLIIDEVWKKVVGGPLIPFAPDKRKRRLAKTFENLSRYVDSYMAKK